MPVYNSHLIRYSDLGVEARIRQERSRLGVSLRQLAGRSGISAARLSNIETAKKVPDVQEVAAIASALRLQLGTLIPRSVQRHFLTRRASVPGAHGLKSLPLADAFVGKHFEPSLVAVPSVPNSAVQLAGHDHEEFLFVLSGEIDIALKTRQGVVTERLAPGDCIYFRSHLPHFHRSTTGETSRALSLVYSLRGGHQNDDEFSVRKQAAHARGDDGDVSDEAAQKIFLLRQSRGWSHAEMAKMVGVKPRHLASIEAGKTVLDLELL